MVIRTKYKFFFNAIEISAIVCNVTRIVAYGNTTLKLKLRSNFLKVF